MSAFDTVFDVAAALTIGRTLNASTARTGGRWGVVGCRDALGAFDAHSDAWVLSNGRDLARWESYEEAAKRARGLSGSSYDDCGYEAVEIPSPAPMAVTVGPVHYAVGPILFDCIDWSSGPGIDVENLDRSAFGAALAFIGLVGRERAEQALQVDS